MASGALKKPQLRGLLTKQIFRNLGITFGLIVGALTTLRIVLVNKRKNAYAEYYSNLDADKLFLDMKDRGVFQSCPSDDKGDDDKNGDKPVDPAPEEK